jgi:hypothetical protein
MASKSNDMEVATEGGRMDATEWSGIPLLEQSSEGEDDINLEMVVRHYQVHHEKPFLQLLEDMHKQAMVWANIIERVKAGDDPALIRTRFQQELQLVPPIVQLPNPDGLALLNKAVNKLSKYRNALVTFIRKWGGKFLDELSLETDLTVGLGVELGFPPAISLTVEHSHTTISEGRWAARAAKP